MPFQLRTTFYSLTLALGVCETVIAAVNTINKGFAPYMQIFSGITAGWALVTWIWISVLLSCNNRPLSSHALTRASTHFKSFTVFAVTWLALTIMLGTQFPLQCDFKTYSDGDANLWCGLGSSTFTVSLLLFAFSLVSAVIVKTSARKTGAGLSANVAHVDKADSDSSAA
ncbi:hypothetical protein FPV67DRAFT_160394 [Lyophyllum atratum]|nr:hypothetical protein FPV67DRAFT_160394 [Lyophyllum atratum]